MEADERINRKTRAMTGEATMTEPLSRYLEESGHVAYCEVPHGGNVIDMVGWRSRDDSLIAIEMKLVCSWQVIRQAARGQLVTPLAYCAVKTQPRKASIARCRKLGVGLLRVCDNAVCMVLSPQLPPGRAVFIRRRHNMLVVLKTMEPGGIAGLPGGPGYTPAQDCERAVREYRAQHPEATWQELYDNVKPNHYAHARSMQSGMRAVAARRAFKVER